MRRDTARRGIISFYQMIYVSDHLPDVSGEENFAVIPYFRRIKRRGTLYSIVSTAMIQGIRAVFVSVEADVSSGMPVFEMVGFLASEVKEAKERVRTALRNSGFLLPAKRITVNVAPADVRKSGAGFDLPVALALLCAMGHLDRAALGDFFVTGEVGLDGKVQAVNGVLPMIAGAKERGITRCIVPLENKKEAQLVAGMQIYGVGSIAAAICAVNGEWTQEEDASETCGEDVCVEQLPDFSDICGQRIGKRACEIAVCGGHNLLLLGSPGSGKTMLAARIPSILPPLLEEEQMELSKIYSVGGLFDKQKGLIRTRPFRAPHHTITAQGLAGGGVVPRPGEISFAHKGVLFLDELAEFDSRTLEILRQPLEERCVRLVRTQGSYEFPAEFMLVAAMNPCKCGYYPDMQKCRCTQTAIERYLGRISGPLLDRIDICVELPRLSFEELNQKGDGERSETIRERVIAARRMQSERYRRETFFCNSQIPAERMREFCGLDRRQEQFMEDAYQRLSLTARSYHKLLKVARTLADMEQSEQILMRHLTEAVCYRSIDKKFWERT